MPRGTVTGADRERRKKEETKGKKRNERRGREKKERLDGYARIPVAFCLDSLLRRPCPGGFCVAPPPPLDSTPNRDRQKIYQAFSETRRIRTAAGISNAGARVSYARHDDWREIVLCFVTSFLRRTNLSCRCPFLFLLPSFSRRATGTLFALVSGAFWRSYGCLFRDFDSFERRFHRYSRCWTVNRKFSGD